MGTDKAFLTLAGEPFVKRISREVSKLTSDVLVITRKGQAGKFEGVLGGGLRIIEDYYELDNPMGGMLSACDRVSKRYVAILGCDMPLVKSAVVLSLYRFANGHSAAVPEWGNGDLEPLCAVYNTEEARAAGLEALSEGRLGCQRLIAHLRDARYVSVEELRKLDRNLLSLVNVNSQRDLRRIRRLGPIR